MFSRIIYGDSFYELDRLESNSVDIVFTSPDPPDTPELMNKLIGVINKSFRIVKNTGSLWVQLGDYHDDDGRQMMLIPERFALSMRDNWFLRSKLVWHRPSDTIQEQTNRFKRDWEYLFFFTKTSDAYYFNQTTDMRTSVFTFPYVKPKSGEFSSGFPEGLIQLAIDTAVPRDGTVLDPFCDSGTTGVVALKNARNFIGIEIVENKIEKIKKRLADITATRHAPQ